MNQEDVSLYQKLLDAYENDSELQIEPLDLKFKVKDPLTMLLLLQPIVRGAPLTKKLLKEPKALNYQNIKNALDVFDEMYEYGISQIILSGENVDFAWKSFQSKHGDKLIEREDLKTKEDTHCVTTYIQGVSLVSKSLRVLSELGVTVVVVEYDGYYAYIDGKYIHIDDAKLFPILYMNILNSYELDNKTYVIVSTLFNIGKERLEVQESLLKAIEENPNAKFIESWFNEHSLTLDFDVHIQRFISNQTPLHERIIRIYDTLKDKDIMRFPINFIEDYLL